MERDYMLLELYKTYTQSKERFIDRSFATNKFYLGLEIVLLVIVALLTALQVSSLYIIILAGIGILVATMWWFNQDSYQYLIKIKYRDVIEKLEQEMPFAPSTLEYKAVSENQKSKKAFVFNDAHKLIAFLILITFFVTFMYHAVPFAAKVFGFGAF